MPIKGPDEFGTQYQYVQVSGSSLEDCCILGYRSVAEEPFSVFDQESWTIWSDGESESFHFLVGSTDFFPGIWRALDGPLYVADQRNSVLRRCAKLEDGQSAKGWEKLKLDLHPVGVWGLPEGPLFVWGWEDEKMQLRSFDGRKWRKLPAPDSIARLQGTAPDQLWAAGADGLLARFDGRGWTEQSVDTEENFTGLAVVSKDEIWATTEGGELFEGSADGWARRARSPKKGQPLLDVASWKGSIWVAGSEAGLLRLAGKKNRLEVVKPNLDASALDSRKDLLIACPGVVAGTSDGKKFEAVGDETFLEERGSERPMWES
ncbi:MAG TPA: hypothetical protein VFI53_12685 [Myxococcaceae bacterium]|nr:hypothetical protein [Myxococcaceae bacterium]